MRFAAVNAIYDAALKNKDIVFITGDLDHAKVKEFETELKNQYLNAGVLEQHIIGIAAGLALSGKKVFVYSIAPFITLRCLEQIKMDVCYQNLDVTIIGVGGGFAYGSVGASHHTIEEIAALRALPNMKIVCPANPMETSLLTKQLIQKGGPAYLRIGKGREEDPETKYPVEYGKGVVIREGGDITLLVSGTIATEALRVADILEKDGVNLEVINMHTIKPIDEKIIVDRLGSQKAIFTLEEHNILGGLGSAVAEVISESSVGRPIFKRFGIPDAWPETAGGQKYLRGVSGISAEIVADKIKKIIR